MPVTLNATLRFVKSGEELRLTITTGGTVGATVSHMPKRIGDPRRRRRHFIKEWREFRALTQEKLADALGGSTTKTSISRIESFKQGYTQESLEAIADALGTHPSTLLSRPPSKADQEAPPAQRRRA